VFIDTEQILVAKPAVPRSSIDRFWPVRYLETRKEQSMATDATIKVSPDLTPSIEQADKILASVIGNTVVSAKADWSEERDAQDRRVVKLTISDPSSSVSALFTPSELKNVKRLERRLIRLWGDLLQEVSHKQSAKLRQVVSELEGD
jgi:hypothetical protein